MGLRRRARQRTLQILYAMEYSPSELPFEQLERRFLRVLPGSRSGYGAFARELTRHVLENQQDLDVSIKPFLRQWTLERLLAVDRIILRMALAEMKYFEGIPLRVTIDEAIELAHAFSDDESPQFINAVLDQLGRGFAQKDFKVKPDMAANSEDGEDADFDFDEAVEADILTSGDHSQTEGRGEGKP